MFKKIEIKNFRGIENLIVDGFTRINIFVGENSIGKTSILDAIYMLINPNNPQLAFITNVFRGLDSINLSQDFWKSLFYNFSENNNIQITLSNQNLINKRSMIIKPFFSGNMSFPLNEKGNSLDVISGITKNKIISGLNIDFVIGKIKHNSFVELQDMNMKTKFDKDYNEILNGNYLNNKTFFDRINIAEKLDRIIKQKKRDKLLEILRTFQNTIVNIELDKDNNILIDDSRFNKSVVYANTYGDGFMKAIHFVCNILENSSSIVLADEIENGLHVKQQMYVWESVFKTIEEENTQLFATSHSIETIKNLYSIAKKENKTDSISVFRLEKNKNGKLQVIRYSSEEIDYAIDNFAEIR